MKREIRYNPLPSQGRFTNWGRVSGILGAGGIGQEPGVVPGGDQAGYVNSGRMGLIGAPTYPMLRDATQVDAARDSGGERDPVRG